jgi:hypothetical protein
MALLNMVGLLTILTGVALFTRGLSKSVDVIHIQPTIRSSYTPGLIQMQKFFSKYQSTHSFSLNTVSNTFVKVPGLTFVFSHPTPLLYRIYFQGSCQTSSVGYFSYLKIMIDEKILVSKKLLPNNDQRLLVEPSWGNNLEKIDSRGGCLIRGATPWDFVPCTKSDIAYLPAGIHSIDVVLRTELFIAVYGGELNIELIEYETGSNISLPILNTQENNF